jgi:hypothetical protein
MVKALKQLFPTARLEVHTALLMFWYVTWDFFSLKLEILLPSETLVNIYQPARR